MSTLSRSYYGLNPVLPFPLMYFSFKFITKRLFSFAAGSGIISNSMYLYRNVHRLSLF